MSSIRYQTFLMVWLTSTRVTYSATKRCVNAYCILEKNKSALSKSGPTIGTILSPHLMVSPVTMHLRYPPVHTSATRRSHLVHPNHATSISKTTQRDLTSTYAIPYKGLKIDPVSLPHEIQRQRSCKLYGIPTIHQRAPSPLKRGLWNIKRLLVR
jgi:hypothetical protein